MGLDMYLAVRLSLYSGEYRAPDKEAVAQLRALSIFEGVPTCDNADAIELKVDVMYWRKANHIHNWFVTNCQDGNDDCGRYHVGREQLVELDRLASEVFMSQSPTVAAEKLPSTAGFFFGGTDYDEHYFEDCRHTMTGLKKLLELSEPGGPLEKWSFEYTSSW